jgi:hypothetical protein
MDEQIGQQLVAVQGNGNGKGEGPPQGPPRLERPARALVGWMAPDQTTLFLCGKRMGETPAPDRLEHADRARRAVAERVPAIDDGTVVSAAPELTEYAAALRADPIGAQYFAEGWDVALADITRVRGFQQSVFTEQAVERVADVDPNDPRALAALTIPTSQVTGSLPVEFDEQRRVFTVLSSDLNLRVMGHFAQPISDGQGGPTVPGIGFLVALFPSLVKVVEFQGSHYLVDGYHRAFGLLARGITKAPVFSRRVETFEEMGVPAGMLPQGQYLGARPPFLPDYHDPEVSTEVSLPIAQRMILIQALELTPSS